MKSLNKAEAGQIIPDQQLLLESEQPTCHCSGPCCLSSMTHISEFELVVGGKRGISKQDLCNIIEELLSLLNNSIH